MVDTSKVRPLILIDVANLKDWRPLSRTNLPSGLPYPFGPYENPFTPQEVMWVNVEFPRWLLELYRYQIRRAIKLQQFPYKYPALSEGWDKYKRKHKLAKGFWEATHALTESLSAWQDNPNIGYWHIGVPDHIKHPLSGTPIAIIIQALENGVPENNLPPRPLFVPIARQVSRNMGRHLEQFLTKYNKPLLAKLKQQPLEPPR